MKCHGINTMLEKRMKMLEKETQEPVDEKMEGDVVVEEESKVEETKVEEEKYEESATLVFDDE